MYNLYILFAEWYSRSTGFFVCSDCGHPKSREDERQDAETQMDKGVLIMGGKVVLRTLALDLESIPPCSSFYSMAFSLPFSPVNAINTSPPIENACQPFEQQGQWQFNGDPTADPSIYARQRPPTMSSGFSSYVRPFQPFPCHIQSSVSRAPTSQMWSEEHLKR